MAAEVAPGSTLLDLTPEQSEKYVALCLKRGDVPVKPHFLSSVKRGELFAYRPLEQALKEPAVLGEETLEESVEKLDKKRHHDENDKESRSVKPPAEKKAKSDRRERGQNKDRRANMKLATAIGQAQLCPTLAATMEVCPFGDECRFSHDKIGFLKCKPDDLGKTCIHFVSQGICPFGLNCRFAKMHVENDLNVNAERIPVTSAMLSSLPQRCLNSISTEVRLALRKRQYRQQDSLQKTAITNNPLLNGSSSVSDALIGSIVDADTMHDTPAELTKKRDALFCSNKLMLAPLTTLGNLPFRRLCVSLGAEVTMSEMAMASSIMEGRPSELALLKRHPSEKYFGIQLASGQPWMLEQCTRFLDKEVQCDFIDLNVACPLDQLHKHLAGSILMTRPSLLKQLGHSMRRGAPSLVSTMKMRMSYDDKWNAHSLIPQLEDCGIGAFFVHGRTSRQRYTKAANWDYVARCKEVASSAAVIGSGDVMSWEDYNRCKQSANVDNILIARGALIKPWIFTEIGEQRLWDISASERLDLMRKFITYGLENWGSDSRGIETTRRYFLELCSFTHRYVPVGLLEHLPQKINGRPPAYYGRSDLETLLGSPSVEAWIDLSTKLLGPVPEGFHFIPKHKSNAYEPTPVEFSNSTAAVAQFAESGQLSDKDYEPQAEG